jgi:type II secretory pathway component PulM
VASAAHSLGGVSRLGDQECQFLPYLSSLQLPLERLHLFPQARILLLAGAVLLCWSPARLGLQELQRLLDRLIPQHVESAFADPQFAADIWDGRLATQGPQNRP